MRILIVDDESLALQRLTRLLNEIGDFGITSFQSSKEALKEIQKNFYDLIFLDISMPEISGLDLANSIMDLTPKSFIVFQTAHSKYALEAFNYGGVGYLLKPVTTESLQKIIKRVKELIPKESKRLMGKSGSDLYIVSPEDIFYIKADLDEVIIRIKETEVYVRRKIGELNKQLSSPNFFRIHRSYIVNIDKIKSMQSVEQSKLEISFNGINEIITSSKDGAKEFREYLERMSL